MKKIVFSLIMVAIMVCTSVIIISCTNKKPEPNRRCTVVVTLGSSERDTIIVDYEPNEVLRIVDGDLVLEDKTTNLDQFRKIAKNVLRFSVIKVDPSIKIINSN